MCLISAGREFHSVGALIANAQAPFVTNHDLGVTSRAPSVDLNGQEGTYQVNKSEMYLGARPFKALKMSKHTHHNTGSLNNFFLPCLLLIYYLLLFILTQQNVLTKWQCWNWVWTYNWNYRCYYRWVLVRYSRHQYRFCHWFKCEWYSTLLTCFYYS